MARACRREPALQKARLIAASGYSRPEDHAKAKEAGFDRLLPKLITFDMLDALLREMAPVSLENGRSDLPFVLGKHTGERVEA